LIKILKISMLYSFRRYTFQDFVVWIYGVAEERGLDIVEGIFRRSCISEHLGHAGSRRGTEEGQQNATTTSGAKIESWIV
jgi:hypothetical protein